MDVEFSHEALGVLGSDAIERLDGTLDQVREGHGKRTRKGKRREETLTSRDSGKLKPRMKTIIERGEAGYGHGILWRSLRIEVDWHNRANQIAQSPLALSGENTSTPVCASPD